MDEPRTHPLFEPSSQEVTEAAALRALAHPLRLRALGLLRLYGPSTATRLAERCGESAALLSYHLRLLAEAGFVVPAEPADLESITTHGRDRWWKAAGATTITSTPPDDDLPATAAYADYDATLVAAYSDRARRWLRVRHEWPRQWRTADNFSDLALRLTAEQTRSLALELAEVLSRYRRHDPADGTPPEGALIVAAQFAVFPEPEQAPPSENDS